MSLSQAQHARLDSLAMITAGSWAGTRVVGLAPGNAPILKDGHGRLHVLERSGRIMGATPKVTRKPAPIRKRQHYPVTRLKLTKAEREAYEKKGQ